MKATLLILAMVACASTPTFSSDPSDANNVMIEAAIRYHYEKPTGELTKADLRKVWGFALGSLPGTDKITDVSALAGLTELRELHLFNNNLTDVSALAGLKRLERLNLEGNPNLTKAEIEKLQKALPNCSIKHNATK